MARLKWGDPFVFDRGGELKSRFLIEAVKVVFVGAGASAIACAKLYISYGVKRENLRLVDRTGVIHAGRTDLNRYKAPFAVRTEERTLAGESGRQFVLENKRSPPQGAGYSGVLFS